MKVKLITSAFFLLTSFAFAQDDGLDTPYEPEPTPEPTPSYTASASSSSDSDSGMKIGVGGRTTFITGGDIVATLEMEKFYIDVNLGFANDETTTTFGIGAAFWYKFMAGDRSDLSLGAGLDFDYASTEIAGVSTSSNTIALFVGAQMRAWLTSNVTINAALGMTIDVDPFALGTGSQGLGSAGITYFFQ